MATSSGVTKPLFIGIGGGTASGKSTLARRLSELAPAGLVSVIYVDSYYKPLDHLPHHDRCKNNFDHPDSLDFALMVEQLRDLSAGRSVQIPAYDFAQHTRAAHSSSFTPTPIIIVEGILSLHPAEVRSMYRLKFFVDTPTDIRLSRRMDRDIAERGRTRESVLAQWNGTVDPMHQMFCEPTRHYADEVLSGTWVGDELVLSVLDRIMSARQAF